jgi:hypothetical protein
MTRRQLSHTKLALFIFFGLVASLSIACRKSETGSSGATSKSNEASSHPGTEAGARELLNEFLKSGADHAALTKPLRPTTADYQAVFEADFARTAETTYTAPWDGGQLIVAPKPGQTELKLASATSEDLKKWNDKALAFPGGYKNVAAKFKDGLTIYRFKFVKPGQDLGMAYDGLIYVNRQWRIFPKPWRIGK